MNMDFTNISILIIITLAVIASIYSVYKAYKRAKEDDGQVTKDELFDIVLSLTGEINKVLSTVNTAKNLDKKSKKEVQSFVSSNLDELIETSDLKDEEKALLKTFGTDNLAKFVMRYDKFDDATKEDFKKLEKEIETKK